MFDCRIPLNLVLNFGTIVCLDAYYSTEFANNTFSCFSCEKHANFNFDVWNWSSPVPFKLGRLKCKKWREIKYTLTDRSKMWPLVVLLPLQEWSPLGFLQKSNCQSEMGDSLCLCDRVIFSVLCSQCVTFQLWTF